MVVCVVEGINLKEMRGAFQIYFVILGSIMAKELLTELCRGKRSEALLLSTRKLSKVINMPQVTAELPEGQFVTELSCSVANW